MPGSNSNNLSRNSTNNNSNGRSPTSGGGSSGPKTKEELQEALHLLDLMHATVAESVQTEEDDEREMIICLHEAAYVTACGTSSRNAVIGGEGEGRFDISKEEERERNQLVIRLTLLFHGYCNEAMENEKTVQPATAEIEHDPNAWRNLPTILPRSEEPIPVPTSSELAVMLTEEHDKDSQDFLFTLGVQKLSRLETNARYDIDRAYFSELARKHRTFVKYTKELAELEETVVAEHEARVTHDMTEEQKVLYKTGSVQKTEGNDRQILWIQEAVELDYFLLIVSETTLRTDIVTRFEQGKMELVLQRRQRIRRIIERRAIKEHLGTRYHEWLTAAHAWTKRRRGKLGVLDLEKRLAHLLIHRYVDNWNKDIEERREKRQLEEFHEAQMNTYLYLVQSEEEERARFALEHDEKFDFAALAEAYFTEKDQLKKNLLIQDIEDLHQKNLLKHRMRRLITWYNFWKGKSLERRWRYLLRNNSQSTLRDFYDRLLRYRTVHREHRFARIELLEHAQAQKEWQECWAEETFARCVLEHEEHVSLSAINHQRVGHYVSTSRALRESAVASMSSNNVLVQTSFRFHTWRRFIKYKKNLIKALELEVRSETAHRRLAFQTFARRYYEYKEALEAAYNEVKMVFDEKDLIKVEAEEERERYWIEKQEHWFRTRQDFHAANILGSQGRRSVTYAVSDYARRADLQKQEFFFHQWRKFLKRRRYLTSIHPVIDQMEFDNEVRLIKPYYRKMTDYVEWIKEKMFEKCLEERFRGAVTTLDKEEHQARFHIEEEQEWQNTRTILAHSRALQVLWRKHLKAVVEVMSVFNQQATIRRYFQTMERFVQHREFIRCQTVIVEQKEAECHEKLRRSYLSKWRGFWWVAIRPRLAEEMARRNDRVVIKRYFKNLSPLKLRLARVAKARASLQRAQLAAKLLDAEMNPRIESSSSRATVVSSRNPFLPPLVRSQDTSKTRRQAVQQK